MQSEEEKLLSSASGIKNNSPQDELSLDRKPSSLYRSLYSGLENGVTIRVTAMKGRGFQIKKRRLGKKDDVPDVYCIIRLNCSKEGDELNPSGWKTSMIKDDTMPNWNESRDFSNIDPPRDLIRVDAYDENSKGKDEYLGSAEFPCEKLLRKRMMEVELRNGSTLTRSYVTLMCVQLASTEHKASEGCGDVVVHCHPEMGDEGFESTLVNGNKTGDSDDDDEEDDDDIVTPLISVSAPTSHPSHISGDGDDESIGSTSSSSSISRKMSKVKSLPGKLGKRFSIRSSKKKKGGEQSL